MRIIKRYENRCLYDASSSSNVTLDDLRDFVMSGIEFQVINAKTDEDLTRQYLIQIILDLEALDNPLFSKESLVQIIRFYGGPMQQWFRQYLEQTLAVMPGVWQSTGKSNI